MHATTALWPVYPVGFPFWPYPFFPFLPAITNERRAA